MFSRAVGREEHCKQILVCMGSACSVLAALGVPPPPPTKAFCAFMVYTSQALGCSARNCLEDILGCMHFPGLSCSGSGSQVLHKGADLVGPGFCALPRSEQVTRCLVSAVTPRCVGGRMHLITSPIPAAWFSACTMGVPSQVCRVSLLGS